MPSEAPPPWLTRKAYAHRGLHNDSIPENSLAAFSAAVEAGLGIECDIRKSADGRAVVFHDDELERLTGRQGRVSRSTIGRLTAMRLRDGSETIPTLRDVLALVNDQVPLLLELKTSRQRPVAPLCRAVRRDLEGYAGDAAVMSFDPRVGRWFSIHDFSRVRELVISEQDSRTLSGALKRRLAAWRAKPHFLAYDIRDLPSAFATRQVRLGRGLLTWTVRGTEQLETALATGATPIIEAAGVAAWNTRA